MAYAVWSVVFGEQPTAAKWNILGTNDASFHDGTGIDDDAILARHILSGVVDNSKWRNAVAFSAYLNANQTVSAGADVVAQCANERYDLGSNYNTGNYRFIAPYNGIYHFDGQVSGVGTTRVRPILVVNGTSKYLGSDFTATANTGQVSADIQLSTNDYVQLAGYILSGTQFYGASGTMATSFNGHLVTRT